MASPGELVKINTECAKRHQPEKWGTPIEPIEYEFPTAVVVGGRAPGRVRRWLGRIACRLDLHWMHVESRSESYDWGSCVRCGFFLSRRTGTSLVLSHKVRVTVMSPEEKREQAISFAFGNGHLSNPNITREMVEKAYDEIHGEKT